jgi:glucosylceramidase
VKPSNELTWMLSSREGGLMLVQQPSLLSSKETVQQAARVWVDPTRQFQEVEGLGGVFIEAAAETWMKLSPLPRQAMLRAYFNPDTGHGYRFCRVHMNSCDFSLENYAHADVAGDDQLEHFSIATDERALISLIQAVQAEAGVPIRILASPWSPSPWMKTNGQMNNGGKLLPEYRKA